jgi:cyclic pyranopterin phosphate synthase
LIHVDPPRTPTTADAAALAQGAARMITYLRVSVTDRCNLRCRYCMPEDQTFLRPDGVLSYEEIVAVARPLAARGVRKIRITGGEPLLRRELHVLVAQLKALPGGPQVVMTTNAMLLAGHAQALKDAGLDRLNVSLDTLRPDRFERLSRRPGLDQALAGLDAAAAAGFEGTKLNTVVMGGVNDDEIPDLLAFSAERGLHQRFIEFMPMASNGYGISAERVPLDEIVSRIRAVDQLEAIERGSGGPATTYQLAGTGQEVGLIAAISLPFCDSCNRLRLTSDGILRSCLFEGGEVSVRDLLADGDPDARLGEALEVLRRVKPVVHEGKGHAHMNRVGG